MRTERTLLDDCPATQALQARFHKLGHGAALWFPCVHRSCVSSTEELRAGFGVVSHDGPEDAQERLHELVLNVVLGVDGQIVLESIERVLTFFIRLHAFVPRNDHVRHAIPAAGGCRGVALPHPLGQLHMGLLCCIVFCICALTERLRDDEQREIKFILKQVADNLLHVLDGVRDRFLNQDLSQAGLDELPNKAAIVAPHGLDTLGVELVVLLRIGPIQSGIALLVHQQIRAINLFELQLDWREEGLAHHVGCLLAQAHGLLD
mmetsp:Transcript_71308/g.185144  ORF Transcript_71308/g.185144 Transcript_71308/m.185144 type:complete len:263 (+) Transcript_71308:600-1388(+)